MTQTAEEEYPSLVNELEAKRKLRDRLETEISELTGRVEILEFHLRNDGQDKPVIRGARK
jgi:hypothetical protein